MSSAILPDKLLHETIQSQNYLVFPIIVCCCVIFYLIKIIDNQTSQINTLQEDRNKIFKLIDNQTSQINILHENYNKTYKIIDNQKLQINNLQLTEYKFTTFFNNFAIEPENSNFEKVRLSNKIYNIDLMRIRTLNHDLIRLLISLGTEINFIMYHHYKGNNISKYEIKDQIDQMTWNIFQTQQHKEYHQCFFVQTQYPYKTIHLYVMHIIFGSKILLHDSTDVTDLFKICYEKMVDYSKMYYQSDTNISKMFDIEETKKLFK